MEAVIVNVKAQKYSSYKNSGVHWLRELPEHWEIYKGKWLFIKQERPARKEDGIITCFRDGEVTLRTNRKTEGFTIALKEHGYQGIRKGDLVIHNMDAFAGAIGISDSDGKSTPVYSACTPRIPNKVNPFYYAYFLKDLAKSGFIESLAKGIRERSTDFRFNDFGLLLLSVPPLSEQTAIAAFLDRKTALIDQAIDIKQKQIELLKERGQILIHKAVTRGLNPNVKMKDSGVEWIGEIPEHWEVKRFKHFTKILSGYSPEQVKFSEEMKINYFKVDDLNNVDENFRLGNSNWFVEHLKIAKVYSSNILLIPKRGGAIGTNKIAVTTTDCIFDTNVMGLEFNLLKVNIDLIAIWLKSRNLITIADTTTIPQINNKHIYPLEIALPKLEEQTEIIQYIKTSSQKLNTAISLKEQEIEKLKEYKATLINSAVTGKIKVSATV